MPGRKASARRCGVSDPAATRPISRTSAMPARAPHGSTRNQPATGQPIRSRRSARRVRRWCSCHSARVSGSGSAPAALASRSLTVVSGRCARSLAVSRRRRPSGADGQTTRRNGNAKAARLAAANNASPRPCSHWGVSDQISSSDSAANAIATADIGHSAGHNRSQKSARRAPPSRNGALKPLSPPGVKRCPLPCPGPQPGRATRAGARRPEGRHDPADPARRRIRRR